MILTDLELAITSTEGVTSYTLSLPSGDSSIGDTDAVYMGTVTYP
jgi:hypothetical protein